MERTIELLALRIAQLEVDKAMLQEKVEKMEVELNDIKKP